MEEQLGDDSTIQPYNVLKKNAAPKNDDCYLVTVAKHNLLLSILHMLKK